MMGNELGIITIRRHEAVVGEDELKCRETPRNVEIPPTLKEKKE